MTGSQAPAPANDVGFASAVRAGVIVAAVVALMWVIETVDLLLPADLDQYGVVSRDLTGLPGIVTAPALHAGYGHLAANSVPLLVLGFFTAVRGLTRFVLATAFIVLTSGVVVWVFGPANAVTVGASGLVFGYFGYIIGRGLFDRRVVDFVLAVIVALFYGSMLWGVLPDRPDISWQGHLGGLIGGVAAAWLLRRSRFGTS